MTANFGTEGNEKVFYTQVLGFATRQSSLPPPLDSTRAESRWVPPHLCGLIWGSVEPVSRGRARHPFPLGLWLALVPAIGIGRLVVTVRIVRRMRVESSVGGTLIRGGPIFVEGGWLIAMPVRLVVLVTKRGGKVAAVNRYKFLGLIERSGRGVCRAERER